MAGIRGSWPGSLATGFFELPPRDLLTKGAFFHSVVGQHPKEYPELRDRAVPMLGRAGSVIIANHRGVHGAHPQHQGGYRAMLIINFLSKI